ncbi:hypothetical protein [Pseudoalteromonas holothuriae]|nr:MULTISPECIES: hypothetical protein [unclassified Pseudoalteromonas]
MSLQPVAATLRYNSQQRLYVATRTTGFTLRLVAATLRRDP